MIHLRGLEPTAEQVASLNLPMPPVFNFSEAEQKEIGAMR